MSEPIAVSVICLTYNHEKYLRRCLESLVSQKTDFRYEVIVHDDASTDGTAAIVREYEEKYPERIKPIYQTENQYSQGVDITGEYIFPCVQGAYIAPCEGDDFWLDENKLQKQFDFLQAHPETFAVAHRNLIVDEQENPIGDSHAGITLNRYFNRQDAERMRSGLFHPCTVMYRNYYREDPEECSKIRALKTIGAHSLMVYYFTYRSDIYLMEEAMSAWRRVQKEGGTNFQSVMAAKPISTKLEILEMHVRYRRYFGKAFHFNDIISGYFGTILKDILKKGEKGRTKLGWLRKLLAKISVLDVLRYPFYRRKAHKNKKGEER